MPTPLQPGGPASGPPPDRKRRRKRDDPQSSATLELDEDSGDMSPEEDPRAAPAAPAAPAPAAAPAPRSPPAAPDAVDLTSRRDDSPPLSSDVERFDGKIVYNPDGSAYIIEDPELSDGDTSLADGLPRLGDGCIIDGRGTSTATERQLEFPQIANAFYVSRNPSLYGALYGRLAAERARVRPDAPVMHSYRVFSFRGGKDALRPPSPPTENPVSVPVKPILMCFMCKLSFGYAKSFVAHAQSDHSLSLLESERDALSRENASAIIQCVGKDKEPLVSFLEPVGPADPPRPNDVGSPTGASEVSTPSMDRRHDRSSPADYENDALLHNGSCDERRPSPPVWRPPRGPGDAIQHSLISVQPPHAINASVQSRSSPNASPPFQPAPPAFLSGTTIGVCPDHLGGRPSGADCPKCELILSSGRLGGPLAGMHSRNSCKTLKCPKCNWHYKYQETLEIHMKEKHPEAETSCIYCIAGQPHPRLARGETYTCGYKPYRCEVCNYSTTTKGNLSIHMQSDKHLNNMQELQNGGGGTPDGPLPPPPQHTPPGPHKPPLPHHSPVGHKPKPTFRCDVCNYETNVARNLRIHMTSEKHTHNMLVLQQNVKHMQTLSALHHRQQSQHQLENLLHFHGGSPGDAPPQNAEAALADMAYNQALMIQLMTGGPAPGHAPPDLGAHVDVGLNPETMEPPPEPADPEPERTFHCCVCNCFSTDSLEALGHHLAQDRTKIREQEILALVAGHYVCKLCTYKTNLKANFQLHCKTDKHLQRLQHVNHVKEGGPRNEWKLKFCGAGAAGGVQVRCCACDYYTNSAHKLQLHAAGARHEAAALLLRHVRDQASRLGRDRARLYHCALCGFGSPTRLPLLQHVRSMKHLQMEQIHQLQRRSEGKDPTPDVSELFQVIPQPNEIVSPYDHENDHKEPLDQKPELTQEQKMMKFIEQQQQQHQQQLANEKDQREREREEDSDTPGPHVCPFCNFSCGSELRLHAHVTSQHAADPSPRPHFMCPLCQDGFKDRSALERHVMQIHSVNSEGLQRLLVLVDQSHWLNNASQGRITSPESGRDNTRESNQEDDREAISPHSEGSAEGETERCATCLRNFRNIDELCAHQNESGHLELKQTPQGPGYLCWKKGCNRYFDNAQALQTHFKEVHARNSTANMSVSEKHVYKYRCNQCSLAFKTVEKLQVHSQYHMIRDATKCVLCGRSFRSILALHKHVETSHSELTEDEVAAFKRSLMNNPLLLAGLQGAVLDGSANEMLRKESLKTPEDELAEMDDRESGINEDSAQNDAENSDDSIVYKDQQFLEDYLNSQAMAEDSYNDPNRKYKCHRCKVAFTRQSYLTAHNKTLLHRKGEKLTYPMEKYLDPNRPFKCDVCKESFTQKNILLVHYNSVSHLHKLKRAMQEQQNNNNAPPVSPGAGGAPPASLALTPKSTSSEEDDRKRYKCNICKVAYTQGSTLDIHMRSVLHQTRAGKLQDLAATGQIDLSRPLIEQPDRQDPAKILQDVLSPKNTSPSSSSSGGPRSSPGARAASPNPARTPPPRAGSRGVSCDKCHASFPTGELLSAHRATTLCGAFGSDAALCADLVNQFDLDRSAVDEMVAKGNPPKKSNSQIYKHLLESFGFDLVMQYNENHQRRQLKLQEEREAAAARVPTPPAPPAPPPPEEEPPDTIELPEIAKSTCQHCNKEFSSVWVLKTHCEEVHKDKVPLEFLEQFAEHFKTEYERKVVAPGSPRAGSPAPSAPPAETPPPPTTAATPRERDSSPERPEPQQNDNDGERAQLLAAQVQEMQAALNMIQLQQQLGQMHPMMAQMLSLGLPLGLNMGALAAMNLQPPLVPLMLPPPPFEGMQFGHDTQPTQAMLKQQQHLMQQQQQQANAAANQKRARTRITDDQLKILRAHFDINNSPSDDAIAKMAKQSGLATKVIKHWFRNTLFKERQRNKDSPYNFNNPPSTTLNLEEYEKTGEAKVTPLNSSASSDEGKPPPEKKIKTSPIPPTVQPIFQQQDVKNEPIDDLSSNEDNKYNSYDNKHQEDKTFNFPMIMPPQSPAPSLTGSDNHVGVSRPTTPNHMSLNSLIQSQLDSIPATSIPQPAHPSMLPPKINPNFASPNAVPPNVLALTPNRSLSPGRGPADFGLSGGNSNGSNSSGSSGKRANRTRFTDYQIKVLQEFFENNAYPKDDDLEYLSKLLGLSPRVIVVWFQNARQKARKVYENQPAVEQPLPGVPDEAGANRFQRTPGLNYQCKKCQLVFQRYYELIRHQKTHCFKEEDAKRSAQAQAAAAQVAATLSSEDSNSSTVEQNAQHALPIPPPSIPASPAPPCLTPTPTAPAYPVSPVTTPQPVPGPDRGQDRTPEKEGSFQCDKCNLVFPRFELWREHQLVHIMNPNLFPSYPPDSPFGILQQHAQLQQLNASLNGEAESRHPLVAMLNQQAGKRKFEDYEIEVDTGDQPKDKRLRTTILPEQLDYLYQKYQIESNPSRKMLENIAREVGLKKRVVQVWFQNTRARERKGQFRAHAQVINKRCPFCPALFKVKSALESHLTTKHADQCARGEINIDALPDEELSTESTPSFGSQQGDRPQNFSQGGAHMLPPIFPPFHSDMEKFIKQYSEESMKRYITELQAHAQAQQNGNESGEKRSGGEIPLDLSKPVDLSRPASECDTVGGDERSDTASETMDYYDEDCDSSQDPITGLRQPGKRYRTQMSALQVKIMKSLFGDYKTPTMAECEALGREIGLPKRVVQVWFQNARAKEKKARLAAGHPEGSEAPSPEECRVCDFKYSHKYSIQDHIFTRNHIAAVRVRLEGSCVVTGTGEDHGAMTLLQMAARLDGGDALHAAFLRPPLHGNGECPS